MGEMNMIDIYLKLRRIYEKSGINCVVFTKSVKHLINYCLEYNQLLIANKKQFNDGGYELCIPKNCPSIKYFL